MKHRVIGVFDSGIGGLAILKTLVRQFPNEDFIYVADAKNLPYGQKTATQISRLVHNIVHYLLKQDVKAIVIACNTATVHAGAIDVGIPVIGMLEPTIEEIVHTTRNKQVLVLGTDATIKSNAYSKALRHHGINTVEVPASLLVELVETGLTGSCSSYQTVANLLEPYRILPFDTVVLGCTHFGWLQPEIKKVFPNVALMDGSQAVARLLASVLERVDQLNDSTKKGHVKLLSTADVTTFDHIKDQLDFIVDDISTITV